MTLGQLLMSIASVRTTMGNSLDENPYLRDYSPNQTSIYKIFKWAYNSSLSTDFRRLRTKDNDDVDVVNVEVTTLRENSTTPNYFETHNADSLSIMWYLASFGALVLFFLIISFSEVCCKKSFSPQQENETEIAPPPYDLFAPPTYDSLYEEKKEKTQKKKKKRRKCEVFVIPVFGDKNSSRVAPLDLPQETVLPRTNRGATFAMAT